MLSSAVRTFGDPDEYAAAIRGTATEITMTGSGCFAAKLVRIDLHHLWTQHFFENLPRLIHASYIAGRAAILFRTEPGPAMVVSGLEITPTAMVRLNDAPEYYYRTSGSSSLGTMSLPVEDLASTSVMAGCDLKLPRDTMLASPPSAAMARLRRLYATAGSLAEDAPEVIANPDAARGLEQALIEAMVACLSDRNDHENSLAQGQHVLVMRRFRRIVEENPEQPLYIPDICKAIRVSERALRMCCQGHLGMAPKHYLLLRRMHLVRRALREAPLEATSVTAIATRYGFWQLGRFAVEYQALFGEPPSATLRRPM
jgi:AraC-like DNA-binding protein